MMAQLIHSKCGSNILLDITDNIRFVVTFGFNKNSLKISHGDLKIKKNTGQSNFYCPNCDMDIEMDSIKGFCGNCGQVFYIGDLKKLEGGGIYCETCRNELGPKDDYNNLSGVISKFSIK